MTDQISIQMTVNGETVQRTVPARLLLSDFIRDHLGLTGTHVGCEQGVCGACTILFDGRPARSCLMFAAQADGARLTTVESMAPDGDLNEIQRAFHENFGLQCGFCTAGILLNTAFFLEHNPNPTEAEVRHDLSGHLCRCTGYQHIVDSVMSAAQKLAQRTDSPA
ncbi:MAG: (2Fe-2S)-binding protein [Acidimicrobiia bacterium]